MFYFYILAGAQLGEVTPTQARASSSHGEKAWLHVMLSHSRAGTAIPQGCLTCGDRWPCSCPSPSLICVPWQCWLSGGAVSCTRLLFCSRGTPTLLSPVLGWRVCEAGLRGWECCWYQLVASLDLSVLSCPQCFQRVSPSAGLPSTEPWLLRGPAGSQLFWSFSSGQFGISSVQWILEPGQELLSLSLSCVNVMTNDEQ